MANKFLIPVYEKVFGKPFSYGSFDNRLQMQKMVYLLQEEGLDIGHYGFDWYKHGPYSQVLLDDMYVEDMYVKEGRPCIQVNYAPEAENLIEKLKGLFHDSGAQAEYGMKNWTECLASLHFLKNKEMGSSATENEVLEELVERKPHLDNEELNRRAYRLLERFGA